MIYPKKVIYLAGPITGLSYGEARHGWREEFAGMMNEHIFTASPMRGKEELSGVKCLTGDPDAFKGSNIALPKSIVCRDRNDVYTCDVMVACFLGSERVSIGTCIEFGWADAFRKPIVMIAEDDDPHRHLMVDTMAGYILGSLEDAAVIVNHLLTPVV
jgi:nucleoside 2-deoxyribosyltransferase